MALCRAALSAIFCVSGVYGQATSTGGDIRGTVVDPSGAAVTGAKLTLTNEERGYSRTAESQTHGEFTIATVPPGIYKLRVEAAGFTPRVVESFEVHVGDVLSPVIQLSVSTVTTEVLVTEAIQSVETERTQQANTIEQRRINNLPINRRNYLDFALLTPGTVETTTLVDDANYRPIQTPNSGLSFGGSNGRGNGFFIDGVENYGASGGVRPSVSQEAAQEFQINRNSFTAEFGNASGGIINIITKSGTNRLHGNVFGFLRHRDIQARNYFDPAKSAFTRLQAGATLGGALKKDRTFFFLAYERLDREETNFVPLQQDASVFTSLTPSQTALFNFFANSGNPQFVALANAVRQALTPANNPRVVQLFRANSGAFPFSETMNTFSVRLDHRFTDNHSIFFRSNTTFDDVFNTSFGALEGYSRGRSPEVTDTTAMIGDQWVISPNWVMETRLMFNYNRFNVVPNDPFGPEININGFGFFGRQIFLPYHGIDRHYQVMNSFTAVNGGHTTKFGFDINPVRVSQVSETFFGGRFTFSDAIPLGLILQQASGDPNITQVIAGILTQAGQQQLIPALAAPITALQAYSLNLPVLYQQGFGNPNYVPMVIRMGFFVQDTWRINRTLTLNYGLRYENERNNRVIPRDNDNFGPRFGFAISPLRSGRMAIRGGYGLYYSQINAQIAGVADPLSGAYINQVLATATTPVPGTTQTSASIYQALLRQGVIGTRTITQQDLAGLGINVGPGLPGAVIFGADRWFENPWAHQASLEIEQGFGPWAVSVAYNFNRAAHLARILGKNVRYTGQRLPDGRPLFARIDPRILQLNIFESSANSFYHAGILQVTRRLARNFTLNTSFTYSKAMDESTDFNSDYSPQDQLNARAERALSPFHQKYRVMFNAVYLSAARNAWLKDWNVAPIVQYNSWRPFNILTGVDVQGDTYVTNKRPAHLGRNAGQGPDFITFDMRLSRRFMWAESRGIEFIAEGFNLLNRTNFKSINNVVGDVPYATLGNPIVGNRQPATFPLAMTSALNPRQFQFGVKINW